jgi:hypothetical protein
MEIRCKKEDCKHNTGCSCRAGAIVVDKATECASYDHEPIKGELIRENGNIFHVADDMAKEHLKSVPLECRAKSCIYNKSEHCQANGITITNGTDNEKDPCADCATYCNA